MTAPAWAYIDAAPTLGRLIQDAAEITVLEVVKLDRSKRVIIFRKLGDLKGQSTNDVIKQQITDGLHPREPKLILDWAEPGKIAVCVRTGPVSLTCIGKFWYETAAGPAPWWTMSRGRSELSMAYLGSAESLQSHVAAILAGQQVVVTAIRHGTRGFKSEDAVAFKNLLRGKDLPVWRIKVRLDMPGSVGQMVDSPEFLVGKGAGTPADVPTLIEQLGSQTAEARIEALERLAAIGRHAKLAAPQIVNALRDANGNVRVSAAAALLRIDPENQQTPAALYKDLHSSESSTRRAAVETLGDSGLDPLTTVKALRNVLRDEDSSVRWAAAESLGRIGPGAAAAVDDLTSLLKDDNLRAIAADALGGIGPPAFAAISELKKLVGSADPAARWSAALALMRISPAHAQQAAGLFIEALGSDDPRTRWDAIWYLHRLPGQSALVSRLVELLSAPAAGTRASACEVLRNMGEEALPAESPLIGLLNDSDPGVQRSAAEALTMIGVQPPAARRRVAEILVQAMGQRGPEISAESRWEAEYYLGRLGPPEGDVMPSLAALLEAEGSQLRLWAADSLGRKGELATVAAPQLRTVLGDPDASVRLAAAEALWLIENDSQAIIAPLESALGNPDAGVGNRAAKFCVALGAAGRPLVEALQRLLHDDDQNASLSASEALWSIHHDPRPLIGTWQRGLRSPAWDVRERTAKIIAQAGSAAKGVAQDLQPLLEDSAGAVRLAAAQAAWRIEPRPGSLSTVLAGVLDDADEAVRIGGAKALAEMGPAGRPAPLALRRLLQDRDVQVRLAAAGALWSIEHQAAEAAPVAIAALGSLEAESRIAAAEVLGQMGAQARAAVPLLKSGMQNRNDLEEVHAALAAALAKIEPGPEPAREQAPPALVQTEQHASSPTPLVNIFLVGALAVVLAIILLAVAKKRVQRNSRQIV